MRITAPWTAFSGLIALAGSSLHPISFPDGPSVHSQAILCSTAVAMHRHCSAEKPLQSRGPDGKGLNTLRMQGRPWGTAGGV